MVRSPETTILTRVTRNHIPEEDIFQNILCFQSVVFSSYTELRMKGETHKSGVDVCAVFLAEPETPTTHLLLR
jgi:hypothetical protein